MQLLKAMPESLDTFEPSYTSSMVKTETIPSEIGFPNLTSDTSLNQKNNKQTSHE